MDQTYKKNKGTAGLKGIQFQLDLLIVCLLNSFRYHKNWKISSENQNAGKYDDIVVEMSNGAAVLIQAKHKDNKKITKNQLFTDNSKHADFSLSKYFFSYQEIKSKYKTRTVIICTNTSINTKDLEKTLTTNLSDTDNMLSYEGSSCSFLTFTDSILPDLRKSADNYFDKNLQNKGIDKSVITDENLKEFLNNFQFFHNYPSEDKLHKIIDQLLSQLKYSSLCRKISYHDIYMKVKDWFQQPNGEYLTDIRVKAMLCEIKSDKYCESLKNYDISFEQNDFNFTDANSNRIFHVTGEGGCLLQTLKIFRALENNKAGQLYVNPHDEIEVQKYAIEAFELRRYAFLIMTLNDEDLKMETGDRIKSILDKYQYKKIIIIGDGNNEPIGDLSQIIGSVMFGDLSKDCRERLSKSKNFDFQGELVSLEQLLTEETEDVAKSLDSGTLQKLVVGDKIEVGRPILSLQGVTARCYITRSFRKEADAMGNRDDAIPEEGIYSVTDKVVLVGDCPGMGKSVVLSNLAIHIKRNNPLLWVIKVNLNEYTRILQSSLKEKKQRISVIELLNSKRNTKLTNEFEHLVFSLKERIVLMLDAVDEVSPDYTDLILGLLGECQKAPNFIKIFTTTRPHLTEKLKEVLNVDCFKMLPFTRQNQIHFLTNYWTYNLELTDKKKIQKCTQYANKLRAKMAKWITTLINQDSPFAAIPLQVGLIAEIFQEKIEWGDKMDWEGCKEFISSDGIDPKLPENFNVTKLYDMFIEKKRGIYLQKVNSIGNPSVTKILKKELEECFIHHRSLALEVILGKEEKDLFTDSYSRHNNLEDCCVLELGIVQKSSDQFQFIHRTFAEYFVATSILNQLLKGQSPEESDQEKNIQFQRILIEKVLVNDEFDVVRTFLERFLHETVISPDVFKKHRSSTHTCNLKFWIYNENPILVLAKEGCLSILQLILKSIDFQVMKSNEINVKDWQESMNKRSNALDELHALVRQAGINFKDETGTSPLLWAVRGGHVKTVKFLIDQGANVNSSDDQNRTALHLAAERPEFDVLECLVERRPNLDARDNKGFTPLLLLAVRNEIDSLQYLANKGADVRIKDNLGGTALHHLAIWGDLDAVECLVENYGADVNDKDADDRTPLHNAARIGELDVVRYFVEECNANVNEVDKDGCTALDLAVRGNKLDIADYLRIYQSSD